MRKFISYSAISMIVLISVIGINLSQLSTQTEQQISRLNRLKQIDPTIRVQWDKKTGTPTRLAGKLSERIDADAQEIAMRFFKANQTLFSMADAEKELSVVKVKTDTRGWQHVKLQQLYNSIKVEANTVLVHINDNKEVRIVSGYYLPNIDLDTTATITSSEAISAARTDLNPKKELSQVPAAELVVYDFDDKTYLAWKTELRSEDPLGVFIYYVDAHTGEVIDSYNDMKFALDRIVYDAGGTSDCTAVARSEGDAATGDAVVDDTYDNTGTVYNYYLTTFARDSYDDIGATIKSCVHFVFPPTMDPNNAAWDGQQLLYGDGDGTAFSPLGQCLDIVAHEYTHAVTDYESDLVYRVQSGALNEALSDIFAALVDSDDWLMGEDCYTPGTAGDALRYLDEPPLGDQPDHMDDYVVTGGDNGGVHTNSGIPNKAAYLMAEGGTHHGVTVVGMGRENMGKVFYDAQLFYLQSKDDFLKARQATVDAVSAVFPGDMAKLNTVKSAWDAVGVGPFGVSFDPSEIRISQDDSEDLIAEVTFEGVPVSGATVTFSSANTSLAAVSPGSGTTGTDGKVSTTVTGLSCGSTKITATADDGTNSASSEIHVSVPTTSELGLIVLIVLLIAVILWSVRKHVSQRIA
ncbi:MAG: M4 family metallopeptidase [bacterium]